jgi:hypothetical protein
VARTAFHRRLQTHIFNARQLAALQKALQTNAPMATPLAGTGHGDTSQFDASAKSLELTIRPDSTGVLTATPGWDVVGNQKLARASEVLDLLTTKSADANEVLRGVTEAYPRTMQFLSELNDARERLGSSGMQLAAIINELSLPPEGRRFLHDHYGINREDLPFAVERAGTPLTHASELSFEDWRLTYSGREERYFDRDAHDDHLRVVDDPYIFTPTLFESDRNVGVPYEKLLRFAARYLELRGASDPMTLEKVREIGRAHV